LISFMVLCFFILVILIPPDLYFQLQYRKVFIQKACFEGFLVSFEAGFLQFMMEPLSNSMISSQRDKD